jgi:CDP-diacylglycerol---glycerol-3-phosphate 3-phosphatidyltransferase
MSQRLASTSPDDASTPDVELLPVIQSGPLSIREEESALSTLFHAIGSSKSAQVDLTSGYFALYAPYQQQVITSSCRWQILAASPKANGFYGSSGISGRIPHGYTILEQRFWRGVKEAGKTNQVDLREWERKDWTYHAKGKFPILMR